MDGSKRRGPEDLDNAIEPANKFSNNNVKPNDPHNISSSNRWIYSNVSLKRNRIVESDRSSFVKSQKILKKILSPNPETSDGSSTNEDDSDHTKTSNTNSKQDSSSPSRPIYESFHDVMKELRDNIMDYEVKLTSLYSKVKQMTMENEKIRNRYTLMCRGVVNDLNSSSGFNQSVDTEEFSSDDETCASDWTEAHDEPETTDNSEKNDEFGIVLPSDKLLRLKEQLDSLEGPISERLKEIGGNQESINNTSVNDLERLGIDPESIPLVKNLRADLKRSLDELKEVRKFTDVRLANLKSVLTTERNISAKAQRDVETSKAYTANAVAFVERANSHIEQYKLVNQTQHNVIVSLQRQLANIQERVQNTHVQSPSDQTNVSEDYNQISEKYRHSLTAYAVLNSISEKQKSDIILLQHLYEEEKKKSFSLTAVVEQQRKYLNPTRLMSSISIPEALSKLSALYDNRCDESAREEQMNLARMATVHQMYKNLLMQKDREHQGVIENLVTEINKLKDTSVSPQKSDPSDYSRNSFDGDVDRAMGNSG